MEVKLQLADHITAERLELAMRLLDVHLEAQPDGSVIGVPIKGTAPPMQHRLECSPSGQVPA